MISSAISYTKAEHVDDISSRLWDIVIIGAGPAGAMAAYELAQHALDVLLIDQSEFPRRKVCGGCLSRRALDLLEQAQLGDLPWRLGAKALHALRLTSGGRTAKIPIPGGCSLSRETFDFALIQEARKKGAVFLPKTKGLLQNPSNDFARIQVFQSGKKSEIRTRIVIVSDGLQGNALRDIQKSGVEISANALLGLSACADIKNFPSGQGVIDMFCAHGGYVGVTRREDDRLEIAAAVRPGFLKSLKTPEHCVSSLMKEAGCAWSGNFPESAWRGTFALSRSRRVLAGTRFFALGDTAGFVEPFTGEGIYWALLQAKTLTTLLKSTNFQWNTLLEKQWPREHQRILTARQRTCGLIAALLRVPAYCHFAVGALRHAPWLAAPLIRYIHGGTNLRTHTP